MVWRPPGVLSGTVFLGALYGLSESLKNKNLNSFLSLPSARGLYIITFIVVVVVVLQLSKLVYKLTGNIKETDLFPEPTKKIPTQGMFLLHISDLAVV